ncbi:Malonyl CoA-acyl carrier protein transacylase [Pseudonocardia sp. Ae168_Ps1]|uniref:acyltransferase domain-containing protein n=1 Tax=unclassified Pseudonocardia TaxID=2619320 RepID=UPI00094B66D2|nr:MULTISPECIES: acyltransferase domain-containing protein [unclassified Pseudonocardia]OLL71672.1 Malonyl CoA-acyl carrier protein transacylase [Pseudonocardia sp. Ae150A_Ps1]OLL77647.1 Malonyl CoA-acyl carrier protein transacylase [Pseudonocardia sp. Ae168_Ps1]OLL88229.1 Malonyl CoA-acyl carrier protein transacylase [Pseudonocardia sp. Ae263_Ps1]OLL91740.1 Malonyl CoA-acyl carrier protein transacylase [Pseudonocardia sp. Ae356_Ps1]
MPGAAERGTAPSAVTPWPVSAAAARDLDAQIERLRAHTTGPGAPDPRDVGWSLATGRAALRHRAVLLPGEHGPVEVAREEAAPRRAAVLFSGQGSQRLGTGRALAARFPVFARALDDVADALDPHLDRPVRDVLWGTGDDAAALLDETGWTQPALFAVEVALFRLVTALGLRPAAVGGHSIGEITAAHVAGVLSLDDAARLVAARATLMQALPAGGAMVAVEASEDEVAPLLGDRVALAAVNGPGSVVVAGDDDAVTALAADLAGRGRRTSRLAVSHAFHSPRMDPMLDAFRDVVEGLTFAEPEIPLVSNLTGELGGLAATDPGYWVRHVRGTVRFADGVRALAADGVDVLVELGPGGVLSAMARDTLGPDSAAHAVPVLRRDRPEEASFAVALGRLHALGVPVDWHTFHAGTGARRVPLPTYAFRGVRHWPAPPTPGNPGGAPGLLPASGARTTADSAHDARTVTDPAPTDRPDPARPGTVAGDPGERYAAMPPAVREKALLDLVRTHTAAVLGHPDPADVGVRSVFKELGFDSLAGVELCDRLARHTGLRLPATLVFSFPTPELAARALGDLLDPGPQEPCGAELAGLEAALAGLPGDGPDRRAVADRLDALAAGLRRPGPGGAVPDEDLDSVSVDRLLDIIDEEFDTA